MNHTMSEPPCAQPLDTGAYLVFDYGISEVVRKITHGGHGPFPLRLFSNTGSFG